MSMLYFFCTSDISVSSKSSRIFCLVSVVSISLFPSQGVTISSVSFLDTSHTNETVWNENESVWILTRLSSELFDSKLSELGLSIDSLQWMSADVHVLIVLGKSFIVTTWASFSSSLEVGEFWLVRSADIIECKDASISSLGEGSELLLNIH